jgi:plasmid maintenance system antidote protein VapI
LDDVEARHPPRGNLAEEFADLELTPTELARQLRVPANRTTRIIQSKRSISGDTPSSGT